MGLKHRTPKSRVASSGDCSVNPRLRDLGSLAGKVVKKNPLVKHLILGVPGSCSVKQLIPKIGEPHSVRGAAC